MASLALVEKYRPLTIESFSGIQKPKAVLTAFVQNPFVSAWILTGQAGTGKTTMAFAVAHELGARQEIGGGVYHVPARKCDLDMIDRTVAQCFYAPMTGSPWNVVIIDEADAMTKPAQLALLSKLDSADPPPSTIWFFTCNSTAALEDRFLSRCRLLKFTTDDLAEPAAKLLQRVWRKETQERHKADRRRRIPEPPDFNAIIKEARMNVREALNLLELELLAPGSFQPTLATPVTRGGKATLGRIYSVGYVGITQPQLTEILDSLGVTLMVDVRINPKTKTTGFSRPELEQAYGRRYQWAGDRLGEDAMTTEGLAWLESLSRSGQTTMLLGREESPGVDHRHTLIAAQLNARGIEVYHLFADEMIPASELSRSIRDGNDYTCEVWRELKVAS